MFWFCLVCCYRQQKSSTKPSPCLLQHSCNKTDVSGFFTYGWFFYTNNSFVPHLFIVSIWLAELSTHIIYLLNIFLTFSGILAAIMIAPILLVAGPFLQYTLLSWKQQWLILIMDEFPYAFVLTPSMWGLGFHRKPIFSSTLIQVNHLIIWITWCIHNFLYYNSYSRFLLQPITKKEAYDFFAVLRDSLNMRRGWRGKGCFLGTGVIAMQFCVFLLFLMLPWTSVSI